ncbi:hypothetical protein P6568_004426 [Pseudomonas aeruginosa]|uniref:hypothetical protein n=1 Tax=Pseudomonas aeruginosa TaxID=287 RepID=UPI000AEE95BB|nr:hypothetical protein [Pseudomonas aeruginosa]EKL8567570.1 hypothetical protein [Pseudomonas aeruginosa]EKU9103174.1 hypothetical protein [Pseudomonas aeruginosa]EKW5500402.1 hypothetical protein [Pseudomonas aeruginosa]HCF0197547.1 hypothetical protein [Pseudomonas aeruginosa]
MGQIIASNGFPLLNDAGAISQAKMEHVTTALYTEFDERRRLQEAQDADRADEGELIALEHQLKGRLKS